MAIHRYYQFDHSLSRQVSWGKLFLNKEQSLSSLPPRIIYNLFWIPFRIVLGFFFQIELEAKRDLSKIQGPIIIAANHGSWIDSFIIGVCFPFNSKAFPIRYAVWWKYYYFLPFTPFLWLLGNFPVKRGVGLDKALAVPIKMLNNNEVIGIFPTGKRTRKHFKEPPNPKRGVAYLASKTNARILPIKIEGNVGLKFRNFLLKKYKIKVKVGETFSLKNKDVNDQDQLKESADLVMKKILAL